MNEWYLSHGKDGFKIECVQVKMRHKVVSACFEALDTVVFHRFCDPPSLAWKIPLGNPKEVENNNLGSLLYEAFSWGFLMPDRHAKSVMDFPVPDEVGEKHWLGPLYWKDDDGEGDPTEEPAEGMTIELDDLGWEETREVFTQRFLGVSADEFVRRFRAGEYDEDEPEYLLDVLVYFPELD